MKWEGFVTTVISWGSKRAAAEMGGGACLGPSSVNDTATRWYHIPATDRLYTRLHLHARLTLHAGIPRLFRGPPLRALNPEEVLSVCRVSTLSTGKLAISLVLSLYSLIQEFFFLLYKQRSTMNEVTRALKPFAALVLS